MPFASESKWNNVCFLLHGSSNVVGFGGEISLPSDAMITLSTTCLSDSRELVGVKATSNNKNSGCLHSRLPGYFG